MLKSASIENVPTALTFKKDKGDDNTKGAVENNIEDEIDPNNRDEHAVENETGQNGHNKPKVNKTLDSKRSNSRNKIRVDENSRKNRLKVDKENAAPWNVGDIALHVAKHTSAWPVKIMEFCGNR